MSIGPSAACVSVTARAHSSGFNRSAATPKPPKLSAAWLTVSAFRAAIATFAPSAASAFAMPRPMPREPAVTSATRSLMPRSTAKAC